METNEERAVSGFPNYTVASNGVVRSYSVKHKGAIRKTTNLTTGYIGLLLRRPGVEKRAKVHRLVAQAFIPNPDNLMDVDHINGDRHDNRVENLRWCTRRQNIMWCIERLGRDSSEAMAEVNRKPIVSTDLSTGTETRWASVSDFIRAHQPVGTRIRVDGVTNCIAGRGKKFGLRVRFLKLSDQQASCGLPVHVEMTDDFRLTA